MAKGVNNVGEVSSTAADKSLTQDASSNKDASKPTNNFKQSYTGYAASYLPSMPKWGGRKPAPKLERTPSGVKSPPPKLERRGTSQMKLERKQSDITRSPPPKSGPSRTNSGIRSPPPKLSRGQSGQSKSAN